MMDRTDVVPPHGQPPPDAQEGTAETEQPTPEVLAALRERAAGLVAELTRLSSQVNHLEEKINSRRRPQVERSAEADVPPADHTTSS
jgi:hypothetical protein